MTALVSCDIYNTVLSCYLANKSYLRVNGQTPNSESANDCVYYGLPLIRLVSGQQIMLTNYEQILNSRANSLNYRARIRSAFCLCTVRNNSEYNWCPLG